MQAWAAELGFSHIGVTRVDDATFEAAAQQSVAGLNAWLDAGFHGDMDYMQRHGDKRALPKQLVPGTNYVFSVRMNYVPAKAGDQWLALEEAGIADSQRGMISVYARGRDYHKVLRSRLQKLADSFAAGLKAAGFAPTLFRCFTDSAPVMEVALAAHNGLGWRGKHTLALSRQGGSFFFLGEIYLSLPEAIQLPQTESVSAHCGQCRACIDVCPTNAIVAPYQLDARRCISYLTIEHPGAIPLELRPLMGNRIYGCDDCQLVCPWNKYAQSSSLPDFDWREPLHGQTLLHYFAWDEEAFLRHTEGSPIRRIGYLRWQRNLAVALGNALAALGSNMQSNVYSNIQSNTVRQEMVLALQSKLSTASDLVREHIEWALLQAH